MFHNIRILVCVIYSFAYIKYYIIKRLKIKRKRRHKGKPKSFSDVFWSALPGSLSGAVSEGPSSARPVLASLILHSRGPEPSLSFNQESDHQPAPSSIALSSFLPSRHLSRPPAMVSQLFLLYFHTLYAAWFPLWLPTQRQSLSLSMVGPTSLSSSMKRLEHNFLAITPSYSKGLHSPLTLSQHPPQKSTHSLFHTRLWAAGEGIFL